MYSREYRNARFLVVEGNTQLRLALERMLKSFGAWYIDLASNGEDAIGKCETGLFDVVICDYQLPGRNGQHVLEELRERKILRHTSLFIMMSSETTREMVLAAIDHQPDAYVNKPVTADILKQRLDSLLVDNEVLYEIKHAQDMEKWSEAIYRCEEKIAKVSKYARWCEKTVAQLYFQSGDYQEALRVYRSVLESRVLIWAQIGIARIHIALAEYAEAEALLRKVVNGAPHCLIACDLLSEVLIHQGQVREAQDLLADAVRMSPTAIRRHARLGEVSWSNQDVDCSAEAFRNAVELGQKSIFDAAENHLGFARSLCEKAESLPIPMRESRVNEALQILQVTAERFALRDHDRFQLEVVTSKAQHALGDWLQRNEALQRAEILYSRVSPNLPNDRLMDYAKVLLASDKALEAEFVLSQLQLLNADDQELLKRIEELREEPVSLAARQKAAQLNREGIHAAEAEDLLQAVTIFEEALEYSPKHPALNLNMIQVLLKILNQTPQDQRCRQLCEGCFARLGHLQPTHKQYPRYQHLKSRFEVTA